MLFDCIGAFLSLLSTYYFIRLNNKAWAVGILATCLNGWLYWQKGIYADVGLEFFYFLTMGYGWYQWDSSSTNPSDKIYTLNQLSLFQGLGLIILLFLTFFSIYYLLEQFTHSTVAFMDAATTSLSLVAQLLMCHKIIITWALWLITDVIYAFMYFQKHLPFHGVLMLIYTGMAIRGYMSWTRSLEDDSLTSAKDLLKNL